MPTGQSEFLTSSDQLAYITSMIIYFDIQHQSVWYILYHILLKCPNNNRNFPHFTLTRITAETWSSCNNQNRKLTYIMGKHWKWDSMNYDVISVLWPHRHQASRRPIKITLMSLLWTDNIWPRYLDTGTDIVKVHIQ